MFDKELEYVRKLLDSRGHKLTYQRKKILSTFLTNPQNHFTPIEIYEKIKKSDESVSIATIYRNIKILKEANIIGEIVHKDEKLYELKLFSKKSVHSHIICSKCGKIIDYIDQNISLKLIEEIGRLEKKYSYNIENVDVNLKAVCKDCMKRGGDYHSTP